MSGNHSLERYYEDVNSYLPYDISIYKFNCRYFSKGIFSRIYNLVNAAFYQGDVNHITGDIHFLSFLLSRRRTLLTILDCVSLQYSRGIKKFFLWYLWYWLPAKRSQLITVISESTRRQVIEILKCSPSKIKVVHCCLSDEFKFSPKEFNHSNPRILHIGTAFNKNLRNHILAVKDISCNFVIIGVLDVEIKNLLESNRINYINFTNLSRQDILNEYLKCDILLFASIYEGFGLPIIEAQAIGRPVVTSNAWSMPEVGGKGAIYVNPADIDSIKRAIHSICSDEDLRLNLISCGLENIKRFSPNRIAEKYADIYRYLCS